MAMRKTELDYVDRLLKTMAASETLGDRIRRLVRSLPVDVKTKRTARIVAFRALHEQRVRKIQEQLNGHFDFGDER